MYYAFIDGAFAYSGNHLKYVKGLTDKDMELFNGFYAVIYRGEKRCSSRFYNEPWRRTESLVPDRPALPKINA